MILANLAACGPVEVVAEGGSGGLEGSESTGESEAETDGAGETDGRADVLDDEPCKQGLCYHLGRSVEVGSGARDLVLLDCDGDAHLDLVVANSDADTLGVARGVGDGTFAEPRTRFAGESPFVLAPGDFDGDGHTDLAVANFVSGTNVVYGDGDCGFSDPLPLHRVDSIGRPLRGSFAVGAGDLDADGYDDVVAELDGPDGRYLGVFYSDGAGGIQHGPLLEVPRSAGDLSLVDLDRDGHLDIVGTSYRDTQFNDGWVLVVRGRGERDFAEAQAFETVTEPGNLTLVDFDEDGWLDLVTAGGSTETYLAVSAGQPDGRFGPAVTLGFGDVDATTANAADLDLDGHIDLVVTLDGPHAIAIVPGRGDGSFAEPLVWGTGREAWRTDGWTPYYVELGDLDEDGRLDIAATNFDGTVSILLSSEP